MHLRRHGGSIIQWILLGCLILNVIFICTMLFFSDIDLNLLMGQRGVMGLLLLDRISRLSFLVGFPTGLVLGWGGALSCVEPVVLSKFIVLVILLFVVLLLKNIEVVVLFTFVELNNIRPLSVLLALVVDLISGHNAIGLFGCFQPSATVFDGAHGFELGDPPIAHDEVIFGLIALFVSQMVEYVFLLLFTVLKESLLGLFEADDAKYDVQEGDDDAIDGGEQGLGDGAGGRVVARVPARDQGQGVAQ